MSIFDIFRPKAVDDSESAMIDIRKEIKRLGKRANPDQVDEATMALRDAGESAVAPLIEVMLNQKEAPTVRARAASALGYIESPKAVDPLITALNDSEALVRWTVVKALTRIGDIRALPALNHLALTDEGDFSPMRNWTLTVKSAAEEAMQKITSKRSEE